MSESSLRTTQLHRLLDRMHAGDHQAREELVRAVAGRLEHLAHTMLRLSNVRRWADTDDIFQNATLRLLRTLEAVRPDSVRDFYKLAATHVRRELLDLARHFGGPHNPATHHVTPPPGQPLEEAGAYVSPEGPAELDKWTHFHEAVERLPAEEREVVGLVFYHGWTQEQVAELFGVSDRTVRRWWRSASENLVEALGEGFPEA